MRLQNCHKQETKAEAVKKMELVVEPLNVRLNINSASILLNVLRAACFTMVEADTCCAPGYTAVTLNSRSASGPGFLFVADESPLHRKLSVYESRA